MKIIKLSSLLLILFAFSCAKEGEVGPEGKKGEKGENGINGEKGVNGSTILSGFSKPTLEIGNIGDFFINLTNMDFYGPKSSTGWGNSISLKGTNQNQFNKSYVYEVLKSGWQRVNNKVYSFNLDISELNNKIFQDGHVGISISFENEKKYEIIPSVFQSVSYSANHSIGSITIYAEKIGDVNLAIPEVAYLKVVLIDAESGI